MPKRKKLTMKQEGFIKDYIALKGNGTQAALKNYDTKDHNTAHVIASENLQKPTVSDRIAQLCAEQGFTLKDALKILHTKIMTEKEVKALSLWFEVTGEKVPAKTENLNKNEHTISLSEEEEEEYRRVRHSVLGN